MISPHITHLKIGKTYSWTTGALLAIISDIHRVLWVSVDPVDVLKLLVLQVFDVKLESDFNAF